VKRTVLIFALALSGAVHARPVPSSPLTTLATPVVNLLTVDHFLAITPRVRAIEQRQLETIETAHRSHHYGTARRLSHHLNVISERLFYDTGTDIWQYVRLRDAIIEIHREIGAVRALREEKAALLIRWREEIAADTAADEVFVREKERLNEDIECLIKNLERWPPEARAAVDRRYEHIVVALLPPVKISRHEARERYEREGEGLRMPPFNPYKDPFFPPKVRRVIVEPR
jgi:hypothetical protein